MLIIYHMALTTISTLYTGGNIVAYFICIINALVEDLNFDVSNIVTTGVTSGVPECTPIIFWGLCWSIVCFLCNVV
jgi:hypothetical protein